MDISALGSGVLLSRRTLRTLSAASDVLIIAAKGTRICRNYMAISTEVYEEWYVVCLDELLCRSDGGFYELSCGVKYAELWTILDRGVGVLGKLIRNVYMLFSSYVDCISCDQQQVTKSSWSDRRIWWHGVLIRNKSPNLFRSSCMPMFWWETWG